MLWLNEKTKLVIHSQPLNLSFVFVLIYKIRNGPFIREIINSAEWVKSNKPYLSAVQIVEVQSAAHKKEFLLFPVRLYKGDPSYIRPWDHDVENVFNPDKNKFFKEGEVSRFLLEDDTGKTIGRIAAFTHPKIERNAEQPTGGCGFFECINDQEAANKLFDMAREWLTRRGKEAMDGPINFGEQDKFWGCLVYGFEPPAYGMNYNPPYYKELFENYGFQNYYKQMVYRYDLGAPPPRKFYVGFERLKHKNPGVNMQHAKKNELEKYGEAFRQVYNETWAKTHESFKEMTEKQVQAIMKQIKPIMAEKGMIYAYDGERPIGLFINVPNLNEVLKYLNGKFNLWAKLKLMYHLKIKKTPKTMAAILFGVVPDYQGKAVDAALAVRGYEWLTSMGYKGVELMWIGDFNPKMMSIAEQLGTTISKELITYRYLFDRTKEFKRHKVVNV